MKPFIIKSCFLLLLLCNSPYVFSQTNKIELKKDCKGTRIRIDGKDFFIKGMNWDYYPIGTNYEYILWNKPESFIREALDSEMLLLKNMGVNAIRVYTGIPPEWITYVYKQYGIYTMLNHTFGRYGLTVDGQWVANTDYANPKVENILLGEITMLAQKYKDTEGLMLFLIGNENNYGLFWEGAETENIPAENRMSTERAVNMYKLFNKAALTIKSIDKNHPVAICNGDLLFLDIIARECKAFDIFGTNIYRGVSFGDTFRKVKKEYGKPVLLTEFGADAYNVKDKKEDAEAQANCLRQNWKEIYENVAGAGQSENCLGGFTFQFSDGWWKYDQTYRLDIHDTTASWSNGGYQNDYTKNEPNMNEEWFGICAKGQTDQRGHYTLFPRAAYYTLKNLLTLDPFSKRTSLKTIHQHFDNN